MVYTTTLRVDLALRVGIDLKLGYASVGFDSRSGIKTKNKLRIENTAKIIINSLSEISYPD